MCVVTACVFLGHSTVGVVISVVVLSFSLLLCYFLCCCVVVMLLLSCCFVVRPTNQVGMRVWPASVQLRQLRC